jgi:hypothetical protein
MILLPEDAEVPGGGGEQVEEQAVEGQAAAEEVRDPRLQTVVAQRQDQDREGRDLLGIRKNIALLYAGARASGAG